FRGRDAGHKLAARLLRPPPSHFGEPRDDRARGWAAGTLFPQPHSTIAAVSALLPPQSNNWCHHEARLLGRGICSCVALNQPPLKGNGVILRPLAEGSLRRWG